MAQDSASAAGVVDARPEADVEHRKAIESASQFALEHRLGSGAAFLADVAALTLASVAAAALEAVLHAHTNQAAAFRFSWTLLRLLLTVPLLAVMLAGSSRIHWHIRRSSGQQVKAVASTLAIGTLLALVGWSLVSDARLADAPAPNALLLLCTFGFFAVGALRISNGAAPGWPGKVRRVLIVGSGVVAKRVTEQLVASQDTEIVGFVDDDPMDGTCLGSIAELPDICRRERVDQVVVAFTRSSSEAIVSALRPIQGRIPITVVPRLFDMLPVTAQVHDLGSGLTGISMAPTGLGRGPRLAKRTFDLVVAGTALLVLSPLLAAVAIAIRLNSKGPAIYRQDRIGRDGMAFEIMKFRSMRVESDKERPSNLPGVAAIGPFPKLKDDPRVTAVGRFLRSTSIDELPQLWNVIKGDMSLVGPRPFTPGDSSNIGGWAERRYDVRPGITGLWQVSGRNDLTFDEMCRLDSIYVNSWSIGLDFRILTRTLGVVSRREGAY
ncbi:MAG: sugar transferase [Acidimicrobiales bacterium]